MGRLAPRANNRSSAIVSQASNQRPRKLHRIARPDDSIGFDRSDALDSLSERRQASPRELAEISHGSLRSALTEHEMIRIRPNKP